MTDEGLSEAARQIVEKRAREVAETERIIEQRRKELEQQQASE